MKKLLMKKVLALITATCPLLLVMAPPDAYATYAFVSFLEPPAGNAAAVLDENLWSNDDPGYILSRPPADRFPLEDAYIQGYYVYSAHGAELPNSPAFFVAGLFEPGTNQTVYRSHVYFHAQPYSSIAQFVFFGFHSERLLVTDVLAYYSYNSGLENRGGLDATGDIQNLGGLLLPGYTFDVFVQSPVPEPETYAMMLAGLGLLGFLARSRRQKAA